MLSTGVVAQVSTGTIAGTITDPTGAVTPGATITATNTATGLSVTAVATSAGFYTIPNPQPGPYTLNVIATGFSEAVENGIDLQVGAQREINIALKVGVITEKIVVTSAAPSIDLVSSSNMPVVNERTIVELPLHGRDWTQLANLQPGVAAVRTQPAVAVTNQRANRGVGNQLTVGGARPQQNNYRVDGISINDYSNGGPGVSSAPTSLSMRSRSSQSSPPTPPRTTVRQPVASSTPQPPADPTNSTGASTSSSGTPPSTHATSSTHPTPSPSFVAINLAYRTADQSSVAKLSFSAIMRVFASTRASLI